uniref:Uncharacterized protein n=1 Tax=Desulfomonile tiedjei TaxID=2358 RepID=A0A7C4AT46_9BACT
MLTFMRILTVLACLVLLLLLAYHFFSPEKDLATGGALRLRIKTQAMVGAATREVAASYQKVAQAKQDDRLPLLGREAESLWKKLSADYKKNSFLDYLNDLKAMTTNLLGTVREEIAIVGTGDAAKIYQSTPTSVHDFSRAVHVWVDVNEKRLHAISGVEGDEAETKVKEELTKLQGELRAAVGELEKRIANIHEERQGFLPAAYRGTQAAEREPASAPREEAAVVPDAGSYTPAPENVLASFRQRYLNRELRRTPYHFKDLKILKSAEGLLPGVYCISFSAEVYHNHDNKRWEKSPVILNVIAKVGSDGIMSTYENFAKNPWDYPISGSCVKPVWGVHDYVWEKVCPYPCMGR